MVVLVMVVLVMVGGSVGDGYGDDIMGDGDGG